MLTQNRVGFLMSLLAGLSAVGCGSASTVLPPHVAIRTVEDTVVLQRSAQGVAFRVTAIVRNEDSRLIQVAMCGMAAQREIEGVWTTVFTPFCASSAVTSLASGDSVVVPVGVFGYTTPNDLPKLDPRMGPGRYRLLFGVGSSDPLGPTGSLVGQVQASTSFIVK
jgi:hypothetical protein